ncbi:ArdC-like ssDNA-binding domain-containing protein [Chromobacterium sp. CV08]|uniref:ArdC-like ssDNA-binding domain-containing protein n=1 Tax=Chromobacterium sp. CV08 TaxID=3133274 RepID=UPI003DA8F87B
MMQANPAGGRHYAAEAARRLHDALAASDPETVLRLPLGGARHFNPVSGTVYRGINHLLLQAALPAGSSDPRWFTYKQVQQLQRGHTALSLQPGAQAGLLLFPGPMGALKGCSVFNGAQLRGLAPLRPPRQAPGEDGLKRLGNAILAELGVREEEGATPLFDPVAQCIRVPQAGYFRSLRELVAARLRLAAQWAEQREDRPRALRRPRRHAPDDPLEDLWSQLTASLLMGLLGVGADLSAPFRPSGLAVPMLQRLRAADFTELLLGAQRVELALTWLGQLSPTLAALQREETQFIRDNLLPVGEQPAPSQAVAEPAADEREAQRREAGRHALLTEVALLAAPELAHLLAGRFGVGEVLPETDSAIHERFQRWARAEIETGRFDALPADARALFGHFLEQREADVGELLRRDEAQQRRQRMDGAIEPVAEALPASAGSAERLIAIQPFRDDKGGWLKVGHQDIIELGLVDQVADEDSRMTPSAVYLAFDEKAPRCDAQRLMDAVDAAGWKVSFLQYVESRDSQIRSYASYFAPLVGYMPKVGDRLKLVEGVASISSKSGSGGWVVSFDDGNKQRALSSGRFYDFIESVIEGDFVGRPAAAAPAREAGPTPAAPAMEF